MRQVESLAPVDSIPASTSSEQVLLALGTGSALLFGGLTIAVARHVPDVRAADLHIHLWVLVHRNDLTVAVARWVTWGGATLLVIPALVLVGTLSRPGPLRLRTRLGGGLLLAVTASVGIYVGLLINGGIGGVRPDVTDWAGTAGGPSYPSGHTTAASILAAACLWAAWPRLRTPRARIAVVTVAAAYALLVGLTRVWLGVHWPSDVVGGWLYAVMWSALAAAAATLARRQNRGAR